MRVLEADLTDAEATRRAFAGLKPQIVFHLAAIHYIPECNADPARALRVNVEATQNVLDAAVAAGAEHFLTASTGAIYPAPYPSESGISCYRRVPTTKAWSR